MDKDKFTTNPHLDAEGFVRSEHEFIAAHEQLHAEMVNPKGWQDVDGVKLPPIVWAEPFITQDGTTIGRPTEFDYEVQAKKALAEHFLNGPVHTFDGEKGTYSDVKCNTCSPWSLLDQADLDRIFEIWSRSSPLQKEQLRNIHSQILRDAT